MKDKKNHNPDLESQYLREFDNAFYRHQTNLSSMKYFAKRLIKYEVEGYFELNEKLKQFHLSTGFGVPDVWIDEWLNKAASEENDSVGGRPSEPDDLPF